MGNRSVLGLVLGLGLRLFKHQTYFLSDYIAPGIIDSFNCPLCSIKNVCQQSLDWTTGLTFLALKIIFVAYNEIPLPVILHPALDQSVTASSISLHMNCTNLNSRWRSCYCYCYKRGSLCPTRVKVLAWIAPYPSLLGGGKVMSTRL